MRKWMQSLNTKKVGGAVAFMAVVLLFCVLTGMGESRVAPDKQVNASDKEAYSGYQVTKDKKLIVTALFDENSCATPVANPEGDLEEGKKYCVDKLDVTLSCETEGADIYYTLDGTAPESELSTGSTTIHYQGETITLTENTKIRAIAVKEGLSTGNEMIQNYAICNVDGIQIDNDVAQVFCGKEAQFNAKVTTGNNSTSESVYWSLEGDYDALTEMNSVTGELFVSPTETKEEIVVVAHSDNPDITDKITVKVVELEQYKVTYNKNAPTGATVTGMVNDTNGSYLKGSEVTVLTNGAVGDTGNKGFSCNGYSFQKWNTKADGSGISYLPGDTFEIAEDTTLYAQWQVLITINSFEVTPRTISLYQGDRYSFAVVVRGTGNLTKEATWEIMGQNMVGTTIDERGELHIDTEESAGTITVRATSKDLPDRWASATVNIKELVRYGITYNAAGGAGDMSSYNNRYIGGTKIAIAECGYQRPGYDFVSWNTAVNGKGHTVKPGDEYEMTQDIIMYAQWKKNASYVEPEPEPVEEEIVVTPVKTDKDYAEDTIALIEAIGDVTNQSLPAIELARQSYNALTDAQKELVGKTELQKLLLREQLFREKFGGNSVTPGGTEGANTVPGSTTTQVHKPVKTGTKFTAGDFKYKVTNASLKEGAVTLIRPVKRSKIERAVVPGKVVYNDVSYKVTGISANAFKNCKNLKKVTIGKNVSSLGKNLFLKSKKCKVVVIKSSKLKRISVNAFNDLPYKSYIKMPDKKYRAYEKLMKKSKLRSDIRLKTY